MKMFNRKRYLTRNHCLLTVWRELGGGNALKSQPKWHFLWQAEPEGSIWMMDRAVNKAAADDQGQSWPRKGKDTALHPQWDRQTDRPSWAAGLRQLLLPPLPPVLITRDHKWWGHRRDQSVPGDLWEKCEAVSPHRCCVKGVQRHIYNIYLYVIYLFYEHSWLETYCLSCYTNQMRRTMNSWSSVHLWHVNTQQDTNISMCLCMTCKAEQMHSRQPADLAVPFRSGLSTKNSVYTGKQIYFLVWKVKNQPNKKKDILEHFQVNSRQFL